MSEHMPTNLPPSNPEGVTEYVKKKANEVVIGDRVNLYNGEATVTGITDVGDLTIFIEREENGEMVRDALHFDRDEKYSDDVEVIVS